MVMPLDVSMRIGTDETVRMLLEVTERMDYRALNASYSRESKAEEATPKQMFQLTVLGYMDQTYSLRRLERACRNDIRYMYILNGKPAPDHNKFWRFIKHHLQGDVAEGLFYQLVRELELCGEISYAHVFVDGTKIEANANRYSFVWSKSVTKHEARLDEKMVSMFKDLAVRYPMNGIGAEQDAKSWLEYLHRLKAEQTVEFVSGRGKRKTQLQRDVEMLESYCERKRQYADCKRILRGRNSFSKTDRDATFMRMKEDHMKNGQLKPGYNLQLAVEGEYIVGVDVSAERSDQTTLLPLLDRMAKGNGGKRHTCVVADAGYESEENYLGVRQRGQIAYIKPQNYEKSKSRKYRTNGFLRENMPYDPIADTYRCPAGATFIHSYDTKRRSKTGFESTVSIYDCAACGDCPQKKLCTRAEGNRRLSLSKQFVSLREQALERIASETGKMMRMNRSIQSEGAFGVLKQDYGFRRFNRRGEAGVFVETLLHAMAFNLNKLHAKSLKCRSGCTLHELSSA